LGIDRSAIVPVAETVGMEKRLDQRVGTYSLGMRQRLGIAQALLGEPKLLILDEPANGLDPAGIREMRELVRGLAEDRGMSIFVSSHLLAEIELMCDRVAIIHRGKILRTGSVRDLISNQRTMEFRVGDPVRAAALFRARGIDVTSTDDRLFAPIEEPDAPPLIAALAQEGIEIFHAREHVQTLEEMFIDVTGGETVG
ncbi:MAG TPA: ABC transporter ATP-binding protein, partial [Thermoanaerobaculia bacterium]|nr:ABC transporter ATP-binding protein [Thermoanaerobaculia bacterium]